MQRRRTVSNRQRTLTFPLKRKALLKAVGVDKFASWEHVCNASLFENVASVGHSLDELAILLDQEDGHVQFALQLQDVLLSTERIVARTSMMPAVDVEALKRGEPTT